MIDLRATRIRKKKKEKEKECTIFSAIHRYLHERSEVNQTFSTFDGQPTFREVHYTRYIIQEDIAK